jgi:hypothetical protein
MSAWTNIDRLMRTRSEGHNSALLANADLVAFCFSRLQRKLTLSRNLIFDLAPGEDPVWASFA